LGFGENSARKKPARLSLIMFIPWNSYYTYRLVSGYVTAHFYEQEELKALRLRAGEYLEESGEYLEAIYQYKEAGE
jgi:hypothetical protein